MRFMKDKSNSLSLDNLQSFLDNTRGQITLGEIPPIRRAALAAQGKKVRVALVCGDDESVAQLLQRLDAGLARVMADGSVIDEVMPEIKRQQSS
jgi:hypothetical protein